MTYSEGGSRFGLLGERLGHSFSPLLHGLLADYEYRLYEVAPDRVEAFLREGDFDGLNVTIPYKRTALACCDEATEKARRLGNVNTLVRRADGSLWGDNTDYDGFAWMLDRAGVSVRGEKALVLGSGGASQTVRAVLEDRGAGSVVTISRRGPDNYENLDRHRDAAILVNATPVGMYPKNDGCPLDLAALPTCRAVFDLIYNPGRTRLLQAAEDRGIPGWNGAGMLAAQAKAAAERFLGRPVEAGLVPMLTETMEKQMRNLLLIGMPGSGKSAVGETLARQLGRTWIDLDERVTETAGETPGAIIRSRGEPAFRAVEQAVLREVSRESGLVISAGGGVVTVPENRVLLRQNSTVIWLRRPLDRLPTEGRPLSVDLEALYRVREPLYRAAADLEADNTGTVEETVRHIREEVGL